MKTRPVERRAAPARHVAVGWLALACLVVGCNAIFSTDYHYRDPATGTGGGGNGSGGSDTGGSGGAGSGGNGSAGAPVGGAGACTPGCMNRACGPDGCGSICGLCDEGFACDFDSGTCERFCGIECGLECGDCPVDPGGGLYCTASGICVCNATCTPDCVDKACGPDGCGGSCGPCGPAEECAYDANAPTPWTCAPFPGTDPTMTFFVTSRGTGSSGGNLGGLAGADARCVQHAEEVGVFGKTWRAYLSTANVAARDRIGGGPWFNAKGLSVVACGSDCLGALHTTGILAELILSERGALLDWSNKRDVLTGTLPDGTPSGFDCAGWTSNEATSEGTVGHLRPDATNWGSQHERGCDVLDMRCTGAGNIYCFAL